MLPLHTHALTPMLTHAPLMFPPHTHPHALTSHTPSCSHLTHPLMLPPHTPPHVPTSHTPSCSHLPQPSCSHHTLPLPPSHQAHQPASCAHMTKWMESGGFYEGMDEDSKSKQLAALIAKRCPNCRSQIEKNEGCLK